MRPRKVAIACCRVSPGYLEKADRKEGIPTDYKGYDRTRRMADILVFCNFNKTLQQDFIINRELKGRLYCFLEPLNVARGLMCSVGR